MKAKVVLLFSGGLDSTVLLWELLERGYDVVALSVLYGQRHEREVGAAELIAGVAKVRHEVLDLGALGAALGSALTDPTRPIPEGHYTDTSMAATVVPNRNMILLAVAIGRAVALGAVAVAYAAHSGDHAIYADCRVDFVHAMATAAARCHDPGVLLLAPFLNMTKRQVAQRGRELGAPLELTWSCYLGGDEHCGRCGTCVERLEALA